MNWKSHKFTFTPTYLCGIKSEHVCTHSHCITIHGTLGWIKFQYYVNLISIIAYTVPEAKLVPFERVRLLQILNSVFVHFNQDFITQSF